MGIYLLSPAFQEGSTGPVVTLNPTNKIRRSTLNVSSDSPSKNGELFQGVS